jgi:hypothetical protein
MTQQLTGLEGKLKAQTRAKNGARQRHEMVRVLVFAAVVAVGAGISSSAADAQPAPGPTFNVRMPALVGSSPVKMVGSSFVKGLRCLRTATRLICAHSKQDLTGTPCVSSRYQASCTPNPTQSLSILIPLAVSRACLTPVSYNSPHPRELG